MINENALQRVEAKVLTLLEEAKVSQLEALTVEQGRRYDAAIGYMMLILKEIDDVKADKSLFDFE